MRYRSFAIEADAIVLISRISMPFQIHKCFRTDHGGCILNAVHLARVGRMATLGR